MCVGSEGDHQGVVGCVSWVGEVEGGVGVLFREGLHCFAEMGIG